MEQNIIQDYLKYKKRVTTIKTSIRIATKRNGLESVRKFTEEMEGLNKKIAVLEDDPNIKKYISLKNQLGRLQTTKALHERHNKDVTKLTQTIGEIEEEMSQMLGDTQLMAKQEVKPVAEIITSIKKPTIQASISYYSINLAWSNKNDQVLKMVSGFLNRSNYMKFEQNPHMMIWQFAYNTTEEIAMVKSIQICAVHLLDILKEDIETDAEIFGKLQTHA